jgi:tRNA(Ile)-lysidine synthase TilS/MesJ
VDVREDEGLPAARAPVAVVKGLRYRKCECGLKDSLPRVNLRRVIKEVAKESLRVMGLRSVLRLLRSQREYSSTLITIP